MNNSGKELSKEELKNVSGGGCGKPTPKYQVGDKFHRAYSASFTEYMHIAGMSYNATLGEWYYDCIVEFGDGTALKSHLSEGHITKKYRHDRS